MWTKFTVVGKYNTTLFIRSKLKYLFLVELVSKKFTPFDIQKHSFVSQFGKVIACKFIAVPNWVILDKKHLLVKHKYLMSFKLINLKASTFNIEPFTIGIPIDQFPTEQWDIYTSICVHMFHANPWMILGIYQRL